MTLQRNATLILKVSTIIFATVIVFFQDLAMVANDALNSEFMSHILAIPFLFGYLIYRKRKMIRASIPFEPSPLHRKVFPHKEIIGTLLFLIAFLTYSYGSYTFTPLEYHMFALPIFVTACTLILFNTQTLKQLAFPILFLFFLMPPPTQIVYALGSTLSIISTQASCTILNLFGLPAKISTAYGNPAITITQPNGTPLSFTVDIACSGIYSLIGFLIFATFIAYIARTKQAHAWKKLVIFLIGLPLIYLLNILRITIIVLLGYNYGMELAMNVFHLLGGWALIFLGTLLLLIITEKTLKIQLFTKKQTIPCPECNLLTEHKQNFCPSCGRLLKYAKVKLNKPDLAKIIILTISVILIISVQAPIFALTKGPADILSQLAADQQPTTEILPQINDYTLDFIYRDKEFEQEAKQDASLIYAYTPTNGSQNTIWVAVEIASARGLLHSWEVCLITWPLSHGYQTTVTQLDLRDVQLLQNPPLIARYFAFQYKDNNITQVVLYWYETSTFTTNTTTQQKHVKISLIAYPNPTEPIQQTEDELLVFGKAVANHWQPMKTWTEIALLISKNGDYLLLIPSTLLIIIILYQALNRIKTKQTNLKAYKKLSKENQTIINATHQTKTTPTAINIAVTYEKLNNKPITTSKLAEKLQQAQETGIIRKQIISVEDEPVLGWKPQLSLPKTERKASSRVHS
jgi:exosortase